MRPPLGGEALERLALHYAGRYATTRAKLSAYLLRKVRERGWKDGDGAEAAVDALVGRFQALGYVNEEAFAESRATSLGRRGFGARRVMQALKIAGIEEADTVGARSIAEDGAWEAAVRFARRKRLGPFASIKAERDERQKAFAAFMRAGHASEMARRLLDMTPGEAVDADEPFFA